MDKAKLSSVLLRFPNVTDLRVEGSSKFLVSLSTPQWSGVNEAVRQRDVSAFLRTELSSEEIERIEFIMTNAPDDLVKGALRTLDLGPNGEISVSANDIGVGLGRHAVQLLDEHAWDEPLEIEVAVTSDGESFLAKEYPFLEVEGSRFGPITVVDASGSSAYLRVAKGSPVKVKISGALSLY